MGERDYYWRDDRGRTGLVSAPNEDVAYRVIQEHEITNFYEHPETVEWEFVQVDDLLDVGDPDVEELEDK